MVSHGEDVGLLCKVGYLTPEQRDRILNVFAEVERLRGSLKALI